MIKLAIIGTNWITHQFLEAALNSQLYQLVAIYSRALDSAQLFVEHYPNDDKIKVYTNLNTLTLDPDIDAVYIASPNALHAEQAINCMQAGKHVIVEKPLASNLIEAQKMYETAILNNVVLFEAFKTEYLPNFEQLKMGLSQIGQIRLANLTYCQYSSRYPKYLAGDLPNTFNPCFSNGSLMDIGFYCLSSAIALWGKPSDLSAHAVKLSTGVDALGVITLIYPEFIVNIMHSKVSDGYAPSEIQGEDGCLLIEGLSECKKITLINRQNKIPVILSQEEKYNSMSYEASQFAQLINQKNIQHSEIQRSLDVMDLLTRIRKLIHVSYPADLISS